MHAPTILSFENSIYFVLEWVESGKQTTRFWENFAAQLANLHQQKSDQFGLDHSNYMGQLLQTNRYFDNFSEFFIDLRFLPPESINSRYPHIIRLSGRQGRLQCTFYILGDQSEPNQHLQETPFLLVQAPSA